MRAITIFRILHAHYKAGAKIEINWAKGGWAEASADTLLQQWDKLDRRDVRVVPPKKHFYQLRP